MDTTTPNPVNYVFPLDGTDVIERSRSTLAVNAADVLAQLGDDQIRRLATELTGDLPVTVGVPGVEPKHLLQFLAVPTLLAELQRRLLDRPSETWEQWRERFVGAANGDGASGGKAG